MAKAKYGYGWLLKFILAAILIAVGLFMFFSPNIIYIITGSVVVIFSLFRVYPLIKSLNKEVLRTINLIEIIFALILGGIMIYAGFQTELDPDSNQLMLSQPWDNLYRWFLAFFLYVRGLIYFVSTTFFDEKSEVPKFIFHILAISFGAILIISTDFKAETLGLLFLIISIVGGGYLAFDGYGGYRKYREYSKSLNEPKETNKDKPKDKNIEKETPKPIEDEVEQPETYVS